MIPKNPIRRRSAFIAYSALASLLLSSPGLNAQSEEAKTFEIGAMPLSEAITEFAKQADIAASVDPSIVEGKQAPALSGTMSIDDGLATLFAGTGLESSVDDGMLTISRQNNSQGSNAPTSSYFQIEEITLVGSQEPTTIFDLEPSVTRSGVAIEDMSRSVQVYNADFIEDLQPANLQEVITMSSNIAFFGENSVSRRPLFLGRGFFVPILKDGASGEYASYETYNMERIEILKGPDSINFGVAEPGGIINLVSKKPKNFNHGEIVLDMNSNPGYTVKTDFGGLLNDEGTLRYRLVGVYGDNDDFKDFSTSEEKLFVAPSIAYDINDIHTVTLWAEYLDLETPLEPGFGITSSGDLAAPMDTIFGHPDNVMENEQYAFGIDLDSDFGTWTTNLKYKFDSFETVLNDSLAPFNYIEALDSVLRIPGRFLSVSEVEMVTFTANGDLDIGGFRNRVSIGLDYRETRTEEYNLSTDFFGAAFLSLSNPIYETTIPSSPIVPDTEFGPTTQSGVFIQNHINLTESLIASGGLRYTQFEPSTNAQITEVEKVSETTPQLGALYKVNESLSIFANYAESFNPTTAVDIDGNQLDPVTGEGFELGIKYNVNDRLNINVAAFDISRVNVPQADPDFDPSNPPPNFNPFNQPQISSGEVDSQGVDIDIIGDVTANWSVIASYGYTKTENRNSSNIIKTGAGQPRHTSNLFTTYRLAELGLPELSLGGGVRYFGSSFADTSDANTIEVDPYLLFNLSVSYEKGPWSASLSIKNLTDEEYFSSAKGTIPIFVQTGEPRIAYLSVKYTF
ncbi:MAG: TonB-dependent receptor [Verrucomicrobiota bacterium]